MGYLAEPLDDRTPEKMFERRWALAVLEQVMNRLQTEMAEAGQADFFSELKDFSAETAVAVPTPKSRARRK